MFRKLLLVVALGCSALCANAQKLEQVFSITGDWNPHGLIPEEVLNGRGSKIWMGSVVYDKDSHTDTFKALTIYDDKFNKEVTFSSPTSILPLLYVDGYRNSYCVPATQDLFNDDAAYEYIVATSIDNSGYACKGFSIVQDDGKVLLSMQLGENEFFPTKYPTDLIDKSDIEVLCVNGNYFLCVNVKIESLGETSGEYREFQIKRIYSFERGKLSTSIKKVCDIPQMKVTPTLPKMNETIKVDLTDLKSPSKLSVIDSNGKVCFTQSIKAGQESMEISTSGMPAGMYIIRVTDGNKEVDNCRIIIR